MTTNVLFFELKIKIRCDPEQLTTAPALGHGWPPSLRHMTHYY